MRVVKVYCRALWRAGRADRPRIDDGTSAAAAVSRRLCAAPAPSRLQYRTRLHSINPDIRCYLTPHSAPFIAATKTQTGHEDCTAHRRDGGDVIKLRTSTIK